MAAASPEPKRFVIVCAARTGSTFLRTWLNAQPNVACHGEVLGRWKSIGFSTKLSRDIWQHFTSDDYKFSAFRRDRVRDAEETWFNPEAFETPLRAIGMKVLYDQLLSVECMRETDWLRNRTDIASIHLTRRDARARYLSMLKRRNFDLTNEDLSDEEVSRDAERIRRSGEVVKNWLGGREWLEIAYEDILCDPESAGRRLYEFLDLPGDPLPFDIKLPESWPAKTA